MVRKEAGRYAGAALVWAQEEHKNMGAWTYVQPRFQTALGGARGLRYAGRSPTASPATGSKFQHLAELRQLLADALGIRPVEVKTVKK